MCKQIGKTYKRSTLSQSQLSYKNGIFLNKFVVFVIDFSSERYNYYSSTNAHHGVVVFCFKGQLPCKRFVDKGNHWHKLYTGHQKKNTTTTKTPYATKTNRRRLFWCISWNHQNTGELSSRMYPVGTLSFRIGSLPILDHAKAIRRRRCCEKGKKGIVIPTLCHSNHYPLSNGLLPRSTPSSKGKPPVLRTVF